MPYFSISCDNPLPPTSGDANDSILYEYIGRVISQWESIEFELSRLYSVFCNDSDGKTMREYGKANIFIDRLSKLREKADSYFINICDQNKEGELHALLSVIEIFSKKRNEIAHGIVMIINDITYFKKNIPQAEDKTLFALIPPYYSIKSHTAEGFPSYSYTSNELKILNKKLILLCGKIKEYRLSFLN